MSQSVFHGGVVLEPRKVPVVLPTRELPLQPRYAVPLATRSGQAANVLVAVGDRVLRGQAIAGGKSNVAAHACTSGTVIEVVTDCHTPRIVITADGEHRGVPARSAPLAPEDADIAQIREAGLVGLGGAGFPTADKLEAALRSHPKTVLINAVECEPIIACDAQLIADDAEGLLFGADWLRRFVGAERCEIVLEAHTPASAERLEAALAEHPFDHLSIAVVPTRYPAGSERQLVHARTGVALAPGARPLDGGVLVQNAATTHALGVWARTGLPLLERLVTVGGEACASPQTVRCPVGTPIQALLDLTGVAAGEVALFSGGPAMGFALEDTSLPVAKHTQCVRVERPRLLPDPSVCIRCAACAEACPENLLPQQLHWHLAADNLPAADAERLNHCILCGCCDMVCPSAIPLSSQFAAGKGALRMRQHTEARAERAKRRVDARNARLATAEALKRERLAKRKAGAAKVDKKQAVADALARAKTKKDAANVHGPASEQTPPTGSDHD